MANKSWLSGFLNRNLTISAEDMQPEAFEDSYWSDVPSEDNDNSTNSDSDSRPGDGGLEIDPEVAARLLPHMPALFSKDLPPCGLIPQVAYENVNKRLRKLWLQHANSHPDNVSILGICTLVKDDLENEVIEAPTDSKLGTKARNPSRRENIFNYEIRWARYFVREAEILGRLPKMNEAELEKQDFMYRLYPIPKELRIVIKNKLNSKMVLELWTAWHHKKRETPPASNVQRSLDAGPTKEEDPGRGANDALKDPMRIQNSDVSVTDRLAADGKQEENLQDKIPLDGEAGERDLRHDDQD